VKKRAIKQEELELQRHLQILSGGLYNPDQANKQLDYPEKEDGATFSFNDLVNLEKVRNEDNFIL